MSNTRTAECPNLGKAERFASSPTIAGPRLPFTIVSKATSNRPDEVRDTLRAAAAIAIAEQAPLETIASETNLAVEDLRRALCDPDFDIPEGTLTKLSRYVKESVREIEEEPFVETRISRVIEDVLDQAAFERLLAIIVGDYRTGKSYAAKRWARIHPHNSVYIEVPSGSDKNIFMRALGQSFGIGCSTAVKATQIEWKIREACKSWKPVIILDEGHRLWNEDHRSIPQRIEFVRDLMSPSIGASIVILATNQFANAQERTELHSQTWGSGQWVGRIGRYEDLPATLEDSELRKVIKVHLGDISERAAASVFEFARASDGFLGSVEAVARMARHLARKDRRAFTSEHVLAAVKALIPTSRTLRKKLLGK